MSSCFLKMNSRSLGNNDYLFKKKTKFPHQQSKPQVHGNLNRSEENISSHKFLLSPPP